jgi:hypothetical protein
LPKVWCDAFLADKLLDLQKEQRNRDLCFLHVAYFLLLELTLRYYRRRMWTEEMFGDFKKHGFDLETTMLRHAPRLSRLTSAAAFLYVWLLSVGSRTIRAGHRHLVDRKDRWDLSIFQIGLRFIDRKLLRFLPFSIPLCRHA